MLVVASTTGAYYLSIVECVYAFMQECSRGVAKSEDAVEAMTDEGAFPRPHTYIGVKTQICLLTTSEMFYVLFLCFFFTEGGLFGEI